MNRKIIIASTVALYVAILSVAWFVGTRQAMSRTEAMLDYAVNDIHVTMDGAIDTMLEHVATTIARHFGRARVRSIEEVAAVAEVFDVDELNIVDATHRIIATNDPAGLGVDMLLKDETRPFTVLTNGSTKVVSQPFRRNAYAESRRKYLGVPLPEGGGYIQVGLDEERVAKMIPSQLAFLFDSVMEDTVCYLCAETASGRLISSQIDEGKIPLLDDIGFDPSKVQDSGETYEETLFGRKAFCRSYIFGGHRFIIIEPKSEFFDTRDTILEVMTVLLALVLGAFAVLIMRISDDAKRIKAFYAAQDAARAKDMEIAQTIQKSALPPDLPDLRYTKLSASMTPARDVGGDFYDFFRLDSGRGAFLVADVSGKGITAALYMMTAKTLIKDTLLAEHSLSSAISKVNADLSRHNPANMFLTAWIGVLDFETGIVEFINAGHNPPVLRRADGTCSWISEKSGPMLAFMDSAKYRTRTLRLSPGDSLFLYTDGVTEAMDPKGALFGEDRLMEALSVAKSGEPSSLCGLARAVVAAFAAGAPAADDLTVLSVQYVSRPHRSARSFPTTQAGISSASEFLDESLASFRDVKLAESDLKPLGPALHIILDEIASNIVKHSGASGFGVDIELLSDEPGIKLVFSDDGAPYNPLMHVDPDTTLEASKRPIGGLGIMMVKKMSDSISYERSRNRNVLTLFKKGRL